MIWYWIIIAVSVLLNAALIIACVAQGARAKKECEERIVSEHAWMRNLDVCQQGNKNLRIEIKAMEDELVDMEKMKNEAENNFEEAKGLINEYVEIVSGKNKLIGEYVKQRDELNTRLNHALADVDIYRNQACDLIKQRDELQRLLDVLNSEFERISSDNTDLRFANSQNIDSIEELNDLADSRQRRIEVLEGTLKALKNENQNFRTQEANMMKEITYSRSKLSEQAAEIRDLEDRNEDLARKLTDKAKELDIAKKNALEALKPFIDSFATTIKLQEAERERNQFDQEISNLRRHVIPALQASVLRERNLATELRQERDRLTVALDILDERFTRYREHTADFLSSLFLPEMKLTAFHAVAAKIMDAPSNEETLTEACST